MLPRLNVLIMDEDGVVRRLQRDGRWAKLHDYYCDFDPRVLVHFNDLYELHVPNYAIDLYVAYESNPTLVYYRASNEQSRNARMKVGQ